jgi:hypothetical protein
MRCGNSGARASVGTLSRPGPAASRFLMMPASQTSAILATALRGRTAVTCVHLPVSPCKFRGSRIVSAGRRAIGARGRYQNRPAPGFDIRKLPSTSAKRAASPTKPESKTH